jgi:tetratricopeptide (TPR) repeat protein
MSDLDPRAAALALFRAGRLAQAEGAWRAILAASPGDAEAQHMLGFILATTGRLEEGLGLLDRSVEAAPRNAAFLDNRAQVLMRAGRDGDARRDLAHATELDPRSLPPWLHYSQVLRRLGERDAALDAITRALAIEPAHPASRYHEGLLRLEAGDFAAAEASFRQVLERTPRHVAALVNLGVALRETGRAGEALVCFQRAAATDPANPDALNNLGLALHHDGQSRDAVRLFKRVLELRPGSGQALVNWGVVLKDAGDLEGAGARFREAIAADGQLVEAHVNLGSLLLELKRLAEARASFERALALQPRSADALAGLAHVELREQRFAAGWDHYEQRFRTNPPTASVRAIALPRLTLENIAGARRVAVWMEQGVGDQVLYSTLLPELVRRGIEVVAETDRRLLGLYRRGGVGAEFLEPEAFTAAIARCDHQAPLGALAGLFRRDAASFAAPPGPILRADPERVAAYRAQLGPGPVIAIAWRTLHKGAKRVLGERKSIPLDAFAHLARASGARLVDLQYGEVGEERGTFESRHPGVLVRLQGLDAFSDLEGVAAALVACGRLVSSDTSTVHLAGALGVPAWLAYLHGWPPYFYWAVVGPGGRSLWYPSVHVPDAGWTSWEEAFEALATRLEREGNG